MSKTIHDIPEADRPREKLRARGAAALKDHELLAILVGKGGAMIKEIGTRARAAAEKFLGCRVDLMLHVDVSPGWTGSPGGLRKMGYS